MFLRLLWTTCPEVTEQHLSTSLNKIWGWGKWLRTSYLSRRNTFQNNLLHVSTSVDTVGCCSTISGRSNSCCWASSGSAIKRRYSTVLVRDPIICCASRFALLRYIWVLAPLKEADNKTYIIKCKNDQSLKVRNRNTVHGMQGHYVPRDLYLPLQIDLLNTKVWNYHMLHGSRDYCV